MTHRHPFPAPGRFAIAVLAAVGGFALLAPSALRGQEGEQENQEREQLVPELEALQKLQEIQQELAPIQQQAFQDSAVRRMARSLDQDLRAAMEEADPQTRQRITRLSSISQEARQARAESDTARMQRLMAESRRLQQRLQQTRNQVLDQEGELQDQYEAFREKLEEAMIELNPEAEELLRQRDSLVTIVREESGEEQEGSGGGGER